MLYELDRSIGTNDRSLLHPNAWWPILKKQYRNAHNRHRDSARTIKAFKNKWRFQWVDAAPGQEVYKMQVPRHIKTLKGVCDDPRSFWNKVSEEKELSYHEPAKFMKLFELEEK